MNIKVNFSGLLQKETEKSTANSVANAPSLFFFSLNSSAHDVTSLGTKMLVCSMRVAPSTTISDFSH